MPTPHDNHFLTLSGASHLPYVIALHRSLQHACADFSLRVVCLDEDAERLLRTLALPGVVRYRVDEIVAYDPRLRDLRGSRQPSEWVWTLKPAALRFVFDAEPELEVLTYLDADILFFGQAKPMFAELGDASVLVFPHYWAPRWAKRERTDGAYNAGMVVFRHDADGLAVLDDWRERCVEHCAAPGGDQIYLHSWPDRFKRVRVSRHPGVGAVPVSRFLDGLHFEGERAFVDGLPLVFYHYTGHKIYQRITLPARLGIHRPSFNFTPRPVPVVWSAAREVESEEHWYLWRLYGRRLSDAMAELRVVEPAYRTGHDGRARLARLTRRSVAHAWHRSPPARAAVALRAASPSRR